MPYADKARWLKSMPDTGRSIILVVVHLAVLPVQVLDLIQTFEQVKVGGAATASPK